MSNTILPEEVSIEAIDLVIKTMKKQISIFSYCNIADMIENGTEAIYGLAGYMDNKEKVLYLKNVDHLK